MSFLSTVHCMIIVTIILTQEIKDHMLELIFRKDLDQIKVTNQMSGLARKRPITALETDKVYLLISYNI